jgi:hypothetical protein
VICQIWVAIPSGAAPLGSYEDLSISGVTAPVESVDQKSCSRSWISSRQIGLTRSLNGFVKNVQHGEHGERVDIEIDGPDEVAKGLELDWEQVAIGGEGLDWQSLGPTYQPCD